MPSVNSGNIVAIAPVKIWRCINSGLMIVLERGSQTKKGRF
ncbi:hypothetical protein [Okeania sp. SIO2C2]|nr:hypothetical protein [Okeania sp. SIO2C2]